MRGRGLACSAAGRRFLLRIVGGGLARRCRRLVGDRAVREHALRLGDGDVVFARWPRLVVALLDQQPRLLALAVAAVHAHERPAAVQLLAVQPELELAGAKPLARVADRLPCAVVPDDHLAGAVLSLRDRPFEARVVDRMVLDLHGHALVVRVEAGSLRYRPALQRAVELEAKVVVQASRRVLLDDERERAARRLATGRLARDVEVALLEIRTQGALHRRSFAGQCASFSISGGTSAASSLAR